VENGDILWSKWLGSVLSSRKLWWYPLAICLVGLVTGGLSLLAMPLLVLAWIVYAMFLASLGMWFSLISRTTTRAYLWTLLTVAGVCVGNWLLTTCASPFLLVGPTRGQAAEAAQWIDLGATAIVPPYTLYELAFYDKEFKNRDWEYYDESGPFGWRRGSPATPATALWYKIQAALLGLTLYGVAGVVLWAMTLGYFPVVTRRMPLVAGGYADEERWIRDGEVSDEEVEERIAQIKKERASHNGLSFAFGIPGLLLGCLSPLPLSMASPGTIEDVLPIGYGLAFLAGVLLIVGLAFAAMYKGRNPAWALLGLLHLLGGLIVLAFLRDQKGRRLDRLEALLRRRKGVTLTGKSPSGAEVVGGWG
jgi:hypothetical protein